MPKQTTRATAEPDDAAGADEQSGRGEQGAEQHGAGPGERNGDVAQLTYEQARDELVTVVTRLESGAESLEESLALWERGEALAARCQQWLDGARDRLAAARGGQDGDGGRPGGRARSGDAPDEGTDDA